MTNILRSHGSLTVLPTVSEAEGRGFESGLVSSTTSLSKFMCAIEFKIYY